jgi:hypothetical protein
LRTITERDAVRAATLLAEWHLQQAGELTRMRMRGLGRQRLHVDDECLVVVARGREEVASLDGWYRTMAVKRSGGGRRLITLEPLKPGGITVTSEPLPPKLRDS